MPARTIRVKPLPLAAAMTAALLVSGLGGCGARGGGPTANGPLNSGSGSDPSRGEICVPGSLGEPQTFGLEQFTSHGEALVVLDRVVLLHPRHERLADSYAVPGAVLIGAPGDWPPKYAGIPSAWKHRQPVHGFRLPPGATFDMVLGVAATATGHARARGMLVYYHDSSGSYVAKDDVAMTIAVGKPGCN